MKILLISGHGAGDVGALGCGYRECDLTRELVNLIAYKLKAFATVDIYSQDRNAFYDCQNGRFSIGKYDYVLEVHFNSATNSSAHGTEIYVTSQEREITVEDKIMQNIGQFFTVRGVKATDFLVIKTVKNKGISSALLETCFISNREDMNTYQTNKDAIANAVVNGIVEGFSLNSVLASPKEEKPVQNQGSTNQDIPNDFVSEKAKFTVTVNEGIYFRDEPTLKSSITGSYEKGESVCYDGYVVREGYAWISWISVSTGKRRWMPVREMKTMEAWGTFE